MKNHSPFPPAKPRRFVTLTFAEALPVDDRAPKGPHYAPGSVWFYPLADKPHAARIAEHFRARGFTVTMQEVTR